MRPLATIVLLLLFSGLGSLLWCADIHAGISRTDDADCSCLLGGLLASDASKTTGTTGSPAGSQHDASRCVSQTPSLVAAPFALSIFGDSFSISDTGPTLVPSLRTDGILHPPRTA